MEGLPGHPVRRPGRRAQRRPDRGRALSGAPADRRRVVLLRHGRTGDNAQGRIQGQLDTPLDDVGRRQAAAAAPLVAAARPDVLLTSDLSRARDTAAPLGEACGRVPLPDRRLRELDLGAWQGRTTEEAAALFPDEHAAWRAGVDVPRGGGETYRAAGERAVACLAEHLPSVPPGGVLVAVTHGGTARGALCLLLEVEPPQWWRFSPLDNACWSVLVEHANGWRLDRHGVGASPDAWAGGLPAPAPREGPVRY